MTTQGVFGECNIYGPVRFLSVLRPSPLKDPLHAKSFLALGRDTQISWAARRPRGHSCAEQELYSGHTGRLEGTQAMPGAMQASGRHPTGTGGQRYRAGTARENCGWRSLAKQTWQDAKERKAGDFVRYTRSVCFGLERSPACWYAGLRTIR